MDYSLILQESSQNGSWIASLCASCFSLIVAIVTIVGLWKVFVKAGKPGWAAIIPFYNLWIILEIVGLPGCLRFILAIIPFVNFFVGIYLLWLLAKSFGKSVAFFIGLLLLSPIFLLIMGFDDSRYLGPDGQPVVPTYTPMPPPPPVMG